MVRRRKRVYRVVHSNTVYCLHSLNGGVANDVIDAIVTVYLSRITSHSVTSDKLRKFRVDQVAFIRIPTPSIRPEYPLFYTSSASMSLKLKIEFGGGLELLFSNQRSHQVIIPSRVTPDPTTSTAPALDGEGKDADITYLIYWLRDNLLKEREELFIENKTV